MTGSDGPDGSITAVVCGPGTDDDFAVTTASLLNGFDASRLAGIVEIDRSGPRPEAGAAPASGVEPGVGWADLAGRHLLFVRAGDLVTPGAVARLSEAVEADPEADLLYADDVGFPADDPGHLIDPAHRPGFSPDRLLAQMYLGPMVTVARELAVAVDPDGTRLRAPLPHDAAVVVADRARAVVHVPEILLHRRLPAVALVADPRSGPAAGRDATAAERGADPGTGPAAGISRWLEARGVPAVARPTAAGEPGHGLGVLRIEPRLEREPPVSIVIPTNGSRRTIGGSETVLVHHAVSSVLDTTTYRNYELVVVISPGGPPDLIGGLRALVEEHRRRDTAGSDGDGPSIRFRHDQRTFNFSNASNRGAVVADSEILVFLNDDTRVISPDWLHRLVMYAGRPDIGAVGARLLYEDGSVQHAGIWTRGGHPTHRYDGFPGHHVGHLAALTVPQNCMAVTGACLAVEAAKFAAVGGFSPLFPGSYNDVDLCLKLADRGHRTVIDPDAVLVHYGSSTRDPGIEDWELAVLHERWRSVLNDDPYDNPHHVAPLSEEFPAPDALVSDHRRRAGLTGHADRRWPPEPLLAGFVRRPPAPGPARDREPVPAVERPLVAIDLDQPEPEPLAASRTTGPLLVEVKSPEPAAPSPAAGPSAERPDRC